MRCSNAASGFVFSARGRLGPLLVTTEERYQDGYGNSRIRLLGLIPIVTKRGPDAGPGHAQPPGGGERVATVDVSSRCRGHLVGGGRRLLVTVPAHGEDVEASLRGGPAGDLRDMHLDRWSDLTDDRAYTLIPFETRVEADRPFGNYSIPSQLRSAWWAGTNREFEFFRATVEQARFAP